jgi:hypothetical protein
MNDEQGESAMRIPPFLRSGGNARQVTQFYAFSKNNDMLSASQHAILVR